MTRECSDERVVVVGPNRLPDRATDKLNLHVVVQALGDDFRREGPIDQSPSIRHDRVPDHLSRVLVLRQGMPGRGGGLKRETSLYERHVAVYPVVAVRDLAGLPSHAQEK